VRRLLDDKITELYPSFLKIAQGLCRGKSFDAYDLLHDTIARIYERDELIINDIIQRGKFKQYVDMSLRTAVHSSSSRFYYIYRKFTNDSEEFTGEGMIDDSLEQMAIRENLYLMISRLPYLEKNVMELYLAGWKIQEISDLTEIPTSYVWRCINESKKLLKEYICYSQMHNRDSSE
jgi:RNA polymerase sigma factor (sigma-70 family)